MTFCLVCMGSTPSRLTSLDKCRTFGGLTQLPASRNWSQGFGSPRRPEARAFSAIFELAKGETKPKPQPKLCSSAWWSPVSNGASIWAGWPPKPCVLLIPDARSGSGLVPRGGRVLRTYQCGVGIQESQDRKQERGYQADHSNYCTVRNLKLANHTFY